METKIKKERKRTSWHYVGGVKVGPVIAAPSGKKRYLPYHDHPEGVFEILDMRALMK
ncbi:hypothetical protein AGMMS49982_08700 [Bacteroidia bacterium]|nr:hypothetical protein AGMMS49982_08700 [Bacteroidia bacterium]